MCWPGGQPVFFLMKKNLAVAHANDEERCAIAVVPISVAHQVVRQY
jgi:hypothetical protein